jgi:hypothetical protein
VAGYSKTYTLDFTASGDTVYTGTDKLEDDIDDIITWLNLIKKSYASATAPTSPVPDGGQLWYDSTNHELHVYNGSSWGDPITDTHKVKADSGDSTEGYLNAKVQYSVAVDETNHKLQLSNDSSSPGNNYVYGTSSGGTKGWRTSAALPNLFAGVSSNDTTPGYLNGKLLAGTGISLTEGSDGGNETLTIGNTHPIDATAGDYIEGSLALPSTIEITAISYTKAATIKLSRGGTFRFIVRVGSSWLTDDVSGWTAGDTAELWVYQYVSTYIRTKIYRNGSPVGTEKQAFWGESVTRWFAACVATPIVNGGLYTDLVTTTIS